MTSAFNFGSVPSLNLAATTTTPSAFNFGQSTGQTSTLPTLGATTNTAFNTNPFGPNTNPLQSTSIGGLAPNPTLTLTLTTAATAATQTSTQQSNAFHGLGGTQTTSSETSADQTLKTSKANKESYIPPEMLPLVEALKQFVKHQKEIREENSQQRFSIQPILDVGSQIEDSLRLALHKIEIDIQRNSKAIDSLKRDTNKLLSSAEMAYRISRLDVMQTPSSYTLAQNKYINASTNQYFFEMIDNFELQMNSYSKQIQELRTHIDNINKPYSCEELLQIMRKQHETLISLAAKVYAIHEEVNQLRFKTQTTFNRQTVEAAAQPRAQTSSVSNAKSLVGPNPFGLNGDERQLGGSYQLSHETNRPSVQGSQLSSPFGSGIGLPATPAVTTSVLSPFSQSTSQTSPSSHSRAKRWTTS